MFPIFVIILVNITSPIYFRDQPVWYFHLLLAIPKLMDLPSVNKLLAQPLSNLLHQENRQVSPPLAITSNSKDICANIPMIMHAYQCIMIDFRNRTDRNKVACCFGLHIVCFKFHHRAMYEGQGKRAFTGEDNSTKMMRGNRNAGTLPILPHSS